MAPARYPMYASRTAADINIHSREALEVPNVTFIQSDQHHQPILIFRCINTVGTCMISKEWHCDTYGRCSTPDLLRMDNQVLHEIETDKEGTLVVLEHAAKIPIPASFSASISTCGDSRCPWPLHIMALVMPGDPRIRFFYSLEPYAPLLATLQRKRVAELAKKIAPSLPAHMVQDAKYHTLGRDHHCRIFTFIRESFLQALHIPDTQDYLNAMSMTDFAPDILDSEIAMRRIEALAGKQQFPLDANSKDLSEDRYLLQLHPVERELASVTDLSCAEYLLIKRVFFQEFFYEVMRSEKDVGMMTGRGKRARLVKVRSEAAHVQWFERAYGWGNRRARRMILGWKVLGLLDERRLLPWIKAGGMLAESDLFDEFDYDDVIAGS